MHDPTIVIESVVPHASLPPLTTTLMRDKAKGGGIAKALAKVGSANRISEGVVMQQADAPVERRVVMQQAQRPSQRPVTTPTKPRTLADIVESQRKTPPPRQVHQRAATQYAAPATGASLAGRVLSGMFKPVRK